MVYECLAFTTVKSLKLAISSSRRFTLRPTKFPTALLASCRDIHQEAVPYFSDAFKSSLPDLTLYYSLHWPQTAQEASLCLLVLVRPFKCSAYRLDKRPDLTTEQLRHGLRVGFNLLPVSLLIMLTDNMYRQR